MDELVQARLLALTLVQPWATLILRFGKDIENRPWAPRQLRAGERFFIHAGRLVDGNAFEWARTHVPGFAGLYSLPTDMPVSAILGAVRFDGAVTGSRSMWFSGPIGWRLSDPAAFDPPLPCRGAQGLWPVPADVLEKAKVTP